MRGGFCFILSSFYANTFGGLEIVHKTWCFWCLTTDILDLMYLQKGKDCCAANTEESETDLATWGPGWLSPFLESPRSELVFFQTDSNSPFLESPRSVFFQTDSKAGSHGLLTYASTSCYGGDTSLTTPCPKVGKDDVSGKSKNVPGILSELQAWAIQLLHSKHWAWRRYGW